MWTVNIESFILLLTKKEKFVIITLEIIKNIWQTILKSYFLQEQWKGFHFYLGQVFVDIAHCAHRYLATALARSETRNKSKTFQNLSTNDITNAYFGTSVIPIERREQICHGNGNNSISPNVSLPHSCTECPITMLYRKGNILFEEYYFYENSHIYF